MRDLRQGILEEFAAFSSGYAFEVGVRSSRSPRSPLRERLFDIEDPAALAAEARRLEAVEARRREVEAASRARTPRRDRAADAREARQESRSVRRATRLACKVCGAPTPANDLGPVAEYCGMQCRSKAHYERNRGEARRRVPVATELLEALREALASGASYAKAGRPFGLNSGRVWVLLNGRSRKAAA